MGHFVYIIFSKSANRFYIGETQNISERLDQHKNGYFKGSSTVIANDWILYFKISCENIIIARKIERHIKNMKSRKYIENLTKYDEMVNKLLERYS